jgi:hypothetical protein
MIAAVGFGVPSSRKDCQDSRNATRQIRAHVMSRPFRLFVGYFKHDTSRRRLVKTFTRICPGVALIEELDRLTGMWGRVLCLRLTFQSESQRTRAREELSLYAIGGHRVRVRDWVERDAAKERRKQPNQTDAGDRTSQRERRNHQAPSVIYNREEGRHKRLKRRGNKSSERLGGAGRRGPWGHRPGARERAAETKQA